MKPIILIICFLGTELKHALGQDSLNLMKYYKPRISKIYFFAGPSSLSIRGFDQTARYSGVTGAYYGNTLVQKIGYSVGADLVHTFSKHFELHTRFLWERKGFKANQDSITLS